MIKWVLIFLLIAEIVLLTLWHFRPQKTYYKIGYVTFKHKLSVSRDTKFCVSTLPYSLSSPYLFSKAIEKTQKSYNNFDFSALSNNFNNTTQGMLDAINIQYALSEKNLNHITQKSLDDDLTFYRDYLYENYNSYSTFDESKNINLGEIEENENIKNLRKKLLNINLKLHNLNLDNSISKPLFDKKTLLQEKEDIEEAIKLENQKILTEKTTRIAIFFDTTKQQILSSVDDKKKTVKNNLLNIFTSQHYTEKSRLQKYLESALGQHDKNIKLNSEFQESLKIFSKKIEDKTTTTTTQKQRQKLKKPDYSLKLFYKVASMAEKEKFTIIFSEPLYIKNGINLKLQQSITKKSIK